MFESIEQLQEAGFTGFVPVKNLQASNCAEVPNERGVYIFFRTSTDAPVFLAESIGGHFKGRNPTVPVETLQQYWIPAANVVYIGKAGNLIGNTTLRRRLRPYMKFGLGLPQAHWGGRYIWQLTDSADLLVCWKPTSHSDPYVEETTLINAFRAIYGTRPFANLAK